MSLQGYSSAASRNLIRAAQGMLEHAQPIIVLGDFGEQREMPKNNTDTLVFRRVLPFGAVATGSGINGAQYVGTPQITANNFILSEGVTPNSNTISFQDVSVTLQNFGVLFKYSSKVENLYEDDVPGEMTKLVGETMGEILELVRYGILKAGTQVRDNLPADFRLARAIAGVFGVKANIITGAHGFNGVTFGSEIYLARNSSAPAMAVTGHEVMHALENASPFLYEKMKASVSRYLRDGAVQRRRAFENRSRIKKNGQYVGPEIGDDYASREVMADLNGEMWMDPRFWREMIARDMNLFRIVAGTLDLPVGDQIVQLPSPKRNAQQGLDRVFNLPEFTGHVEPGRQYFLVDDTLTQGGAFAALTAYIESRGGEVIGSAALTGKQASAKLALSDDTLESLREKHGDIEPQFQAATGRGYDSLTESEARYLAGYRPANALRNRIVQEGNAAFDTESAGGVPQGQVNPSSLARARSGGAAYAGPPKKRRTATMPPSAPATTEATPRGGLFVVGTGANASACKPGSAGMAGEGSESASDEPGQPILTAAEQKVIDDPAAEHGENIKAVTFDKNVVAWLLNPDGTMAAAWGILKSYRKGEERPSSERTAQKKVSKGNKDDDGGHGVAFRFVGAQGMKNMFSQCRDFNQSAYRKMENDIVRFIDAGNNVEFNFALGDVDAQGRPGAIAVKFRVIDKAGRQIAEFRDTFRNEAGQIYIRKA